jgi:hypothetical protein
MIWKEVRLIFTQNGACLSNGEYCLRLDSRNVGYVERLEAHMYTAPKELVEAIPRMENLKAAVMSANWRIYDGQVEQLALSLISSPRLTSLSLLFSLQELSQNYEHQQLFLIELEKRDFDSLQFQIKNCNLKRLAEANDVEEYQEQLWTAIRLPSNLTSLKISCDYLHFNFSHLLHLTELKKLVLAEVLLDINQFQNEFLQVISNVFELFLLKVGFPQRFNCSLSLPKLRHLTLTTRRDNYCCFDLVEAAPNMEVLVVDCPSLDELHGVLSTVQLKQLRSLRISGFERGINLVPDMMTALVKKFPTLENLEFKGQHWPADRMKLQEPQAYLPRFSEILQEHLDGNLSFFPLSTKRRRIES